MIESKNYILDYTWFQISLASWKKFPHPQRPDIVNIEIIDKNFKDGVLSVTRLFTISPPLALKYLGHYVYCVEYSTIDPKNQIMILESSNISAKSWINIKEICKYTDNLNNTTNLEQTFHVNSSFGKRIESWALEIFRDNSSKGVQILIDSVS